jgi:hypothetical protein
MGDVSRYMYLIDIWSILRPFEIFYGYLVYLVVILCMFSNVGILYK